MLQKITIKFRVKTAKPLTNLLRSLEEITGEELEMVDTYSEEIKK